MIYLLCFALSAFFAYLAGKQKNRCIFLLLSVLSILLPVLLAGLRDWNVGIDTLNYFEKKEFWATASTVDHISEYFAYYLSKGYGEYLFALLMAVVGQTRNYTLFLVIVHAWIIICIYIGAFRLRKHVRPWLVLLLFYLAFFNHSLNVMRQYMAMSFVFVFLEDLLQKKYLRFVLATVFSMLFHTAGLFCFGLLIAHWLLYGDFRRFKGFNPSLRKRMLFIFAAVAVVVVIFHPLASLMLDLGILHAKYAFFLKEPFTSYNLLVVLFLLVEMVVLFLLRKELKGKFEAFNFFAVLSVVYLILYQVTAVVIYGKRIAACCSLANLVTLAMLPDGLGNGITLTLPQRLGGRQITMFSFLAKIDEKKKRALGTVLVIAAVLFYWWYVYALRNSSGTMPYRFIFQ